MRINFSKNIFKYSPKIIRNFYAKTYYRYRSEHNNRSISYSQFGEDLIISRFFGNLSNGFFIDIGAFHPIKFSNTYKFYKWGWNGINIEANPEPIKLFNQIRSRDLNLNLAISDKKELLNYYKFDFQTLNTFSKEQAFNNSTKKGYQIKEINEIQTFTLKETLDIYLKDNLRIDFMNIDVEGFDLKVIKSNDWNKYRPKLILAERDHVDDKNFEGQIYKTLLSLNYKYWCQAGLTMFFIDNE